MPGRWRSAARALIVLLTIGIVPAAIALPKAACNSTMVVGADGWEAITPPAFSAGDQTLVAYSVDRVRPATIFVSNGDAIQRSLDGGCNFTEVYGGGEEAPSAGKVTQVVAPGGPTVYATLDVGSPLGPLAVLVSRDGGQTWSQSGNGVLPVGRPLGLVASPSRPETAYLLVDASVGSESSRLVYVTRDSGAAWEMASAQTPALGGVELDELVVDPADPGTLWGAGPAGLLRSTDGGRAWSPTAVKAAISVLTLAAPGRISAFSAGQARAFVSRDGGTKWTKIWTPVAGDPPGTDDLVQSAASTAAETYVSVGAHTASVYRLGEDGVWVPLTSPQLQARPAFADIQVRGTTRVPYALTPQAVMRLARVVPNPSEVYSAHGPTHSEFVGGVHKCDAKGEPGPVSAPAVDRLSPAGETVVLSPGDQETVTYELALAPKPLDVFFLLDTSRSAGNGNIGCSILQGILDASASLAADSSLSVRVGLGETRQYARYRPTVAQIGQLPEESAADYYAYRLRRTVERMDQEFRDAAARIDFGAASGANLAALYQAATGLGQDVAPAGPSEDDIAPGQAAGFHEDALPVIFHVVDGWFSDPDRTQGYPGPSFAETAGLLRAYGIEQAALWTNDIHSEKTDPTSEGDRTHDRPGRSAKEDAESMARATDALAQSPVDCDANQYPELLVNDPLVCPFRGGVTVANAIENILRSYRDPQPVSLTVEDRIGFVGEIAPASHEGVDLLRRHDLTFRVTYSCERDQAGRLEEVGLAATAGGVEVAQVTTLVECVGLPPPPPPAIVPPVVPALAIPPPPPPVQPVTAGAPAQAPANVPAPQPQPAPAQAQASQAQAAAVPQRQVQPQVALVHASNAVQERVGLEYMMVRAHRGPDAVERARLLVGLGGLGLISMFGIARVRLARSVVRARR